MDSPSRLNLIFHGMLGLVKPQNGAGWDIYVPVPEAHPSGDDMPIHVALWGAPKTGTSPLDGLTPIANENFVLTFTGSNPPNPPCDFDAAEALVLKDLIPQPAAVWSRISVPPPALIRKFCGIETFPGPTPDPNTKPHLVAQPRVYYEITVFSYSRVTGKIELKGDKGTLTEIVAENGVANWNIYYQTPHDPKMRHKTTPFDNMFRAGTAPIDVGSLTSDAPTSTKQADSPPAYLAPGTKLEWNDLLSLSELNKQTPTPGKFFPRTHLDPTSCGAITVQL